MSKDVETSEDTLRDGTIVRTRTTNTRQQQLTTERLVLGGTRLFEHDRDLGEDDVFDSLKRMTSPRPPSSIGKNLYFFI